MQEAGRVHFLEAVEERGTIALIAASDGYGFN
jgi:hypothetical protein